MRVKVKARAERSMFQLSFITPDSSTTNPQPLLYIVWRLSRCACVCRSWRQCVGARQPGWGSCLRSSWSCRTSWRRCTLSMLRDWGRCGRSRDSWNTDWSSSGSRAAPADPKSRRRRYMRGPQQSQSDCAQMTVWCNDKLYPVWIIPVPNAIWCMYQRSSSVCGRDSVTGRQIRAHTYGVGEPVLDWFAHWAWILHFNYQLGQGCSNFLNPISSLIKSDCLNTVDFSGNLSSICIKFLLLFILFCMCAFNVDNAGVNGVNDSRIFFR